MNYIDTIQKSMTYIEEHLTDELSVGILAGACGYSKFHYCRIFQECMGMSAMSYIRQRRFIHAVSELANDRPIIDVAMEYGFASQGGFNKAFKRLFGFPPGKYQISMFRELPDHVKLFKWENTNLKEDILMKILLTDTEKNLQKGFELAEKTYGHLIGRGDYTLDFWRDCLKKTPELLVYAEDDNQLCGIAWGWAENEMVTIEFVTVDEDHRNRGIGTALLEELEKRVKSLGFKGTVVGATPEDENFYFKVGYTANLFIQAENISHDDLRSLNPGYKEVGANIYNGWNTLMLEIPAVDRELQVKYEKAFPGCATQTVFMKYLT